MKTVILQDTFAPSMDGPAFLPANSFADAEPDTVHALVKAGKALYVDKKDDPTRGHMLTAGDRLIEAVKAAIDAAQAEAAAAAKPAKAAKAD